MIKKGYYRDAKGAVYEVINDAVQAQTKEEQVIYRDTQGQLWVLPARAWNETVEGVPAFQMLEKQAGYLEYMLRRQAFHRKKETKREIDIKKRLRKK